VDTEKVRLGSDDLLASLRLCVGDANVLIGDDVRSRHPGFFMESIGADAIVRPSTTQQVSEVLSLCNAARQPVVVHGGLSGWVRATQTMAGEIVLSLELMDQIESVDCANRTVTVQAGVVLQKLQDHVQQFDLDFPLDLGGRGSCQVGGNASTNAGGMRVLRYGMMREQVLGVEAVLADGRVMSSMNRMIKNNTGYDLKQLFIGSEGTLGVITRLVLRLRELPRSSNTAIVAASSFGQIATLLRHMDRSLGGLLSAFEMMDHRFYGLNTAPGRHPAPLRHPGPYFAIIEALGADQGRDTEIFEAALAEASEANLLEDAVIARSEREREAIWAIREDLAHVVREFQPFYAFDVSLPVGDMEPYMRSVEQRLHTRWPEGAIAFLGHVADGNLHIAIGAGSSSDREHVESCVYEPLAAYGGSVSAEHGIGLEKKSWLPISRNVAERALMMEIKRLLDPNTILNPGKVFDLPLARESWDGPAGLRGEA
jgi:FAD/FMN-containing dehydrogenase